MIITIREIIDLVIMTGFIGFIFKDVFIRHEQFDPMNYLRKRFSLESLWFACIVTAPAIILHELAHKFVAISFGIQATFHAAYTWLIIGLFLKLANFGFIFFIPGYVTHSGDITPLLGSIIAVSGPLVNLALWIVPMLVLKYASINKKYIQILVLTQRINMFLFIFNMLPIPPFDGYHFFSGLFRSF